MEGEITVLLLKRTVNMLNILVYIAVDTEALIIILHINHYYHPSKIITATREIATRQDRTG